MEKRMFLIVGLKFTFPLSLIFHLSLIISYTDILASASHSSQAQRGLGSCRGSNNTQVSKSRHFGSWPPLRGQPMRGRLKCGLATVIQQSQGRTWRLRSPFMIRNLLDYGENAARTLPRSAINLVGLGNTAPDLLPIGASAPDFDRGKARCKLTVWKKGACFDAQFLKPQTA